MSQAQGRLFSAKLLPAVKKVTAQWFHAGDLAARLAQVPSDRGSPTQYTAARYPSRSRSPTPAEIPEEEYETRCYQALLDDGSRPLFPISLILQVSTDVDANHDLLRPWTQHPCTSNPSDWQVFSMQLLRWEEFRKWQLRNRRQTVEFSEYLKGQQRMFDRMGMVAGDDDEAEAVLSRYVEGAKELLTDYGFVQPFQLDANPKQQDRWTTYVEYLAFECYWLGRLTRSAKRLRMRRATEWERLVKAGVVRPIDSDDDLTSTEVEDMRDDRAERAARGLPSPFDDATRRYDILREYVNNTPKCQTTKREAAHQQCRVEWVQSEISKIVAEQKAAGKSSKPLGTGSRKRKSTDDTDPEEPIAKHRRTHETKNIIAAQSETSRTTRSKKRTLPADEGTLEPQLKAEERVAGESDGPGTSRKIRKATHEQDGSEGLKQCPRSESRDGSGPGPGHLDSHYRLTTPSAAKALISRNCSSGFSQQATEYTAPRDES
ncbi:hypothetical protein B0A55_11092 [Friedmanniomyces simplex]|uniref:Uncharacterized protein n=1 Tax=Friedmanniomyces simplex TaxID=329884 RepID=A0A4V5NDJ4_9PEZI|nr:hypothetical protein B0A55_11092 [Friedmanniomyces simplex]